MNVNIYINQKQDGEFEEEKFYTEDEMQTERPISWDWEHKYKGMLRAIEMTSLKLWQRTHQKRLLHK